MCIFALASALKPNVPERGVVKAHESYHTLVFTLFYQCKHQSVVQFVCRIQTTWDPALKRLPRGGRSTRQSAAGASVPVRVAHNRHRPGSHAACLNKAHVHGAGTMPTTKDFKLEVVLRAVHPPQLSRRSPSESLCNSNAGSTRIAHCCGGWRQRAWSGM